MLNIAEIFKSIQGESCYAGIPCTFIRLSGCNLRCKYCDTSWAWKNGEFLSLDEVMAKVDKLGCGLVEVTGGEPLVQDECIELLEKLLHAGYTVMLETNGTLSLKNVPDRVIKIVDIKCPGSGESGKNLYSNLKMVTISDEVKFVITGIDDYKWAKKIMKKYHLHENTRVSVSPVERRTGSHSFCREVAGWMVEDGLPARLNLQLHKILWPKVKRGK